MTYYRFFLYTLAFGLCSMFVNCSCKSESLQNTDKNPRIINIINFIRQTDYRVVNSDSLMFHTVEEQIKLVNKYNLPATFLLQYDALINPNYQQLLKTQLNQFSEVGGWFEITQPQVEAAGLKWRGEHSWVSHANIAFSTGYTVDEREKLVDVYMNKFKEIFGEYPKSMGSWYIDAHTLNYMYEKYGIVASCNCKDQIGTDGYTLWGGYWNQAYYPSKLNGYMPAQTEEGQIPVPVFRMLGSDPIYQYEDGRGTNSQGVISLEPVYENAGMNRQWVDYFFNSIVEQPCLTFNYAQAGQENSFTWEPMRKGLEMQIPLIDSLRQIGKIRVETLEKSGRWFKENFSLTPATAITAMQDVRKEGNKTVWFNSRFYRISLMWKNSDFFIRDFHLFNEQFKSDYLEQPGTGSQFFFYTLPIVDEHIWSSATERADIHLFSIRDNSHKQIVQFQNPIITEKGNKNLIVEDKDLEDNLFLISLTENRLEISCEKENNDFDWGMELWVPDKSVLPFTDVSGNKIKAKFKGFEYDLNLVCGKAELSENGLILLPDASNKIVLDCTN